MTPTYASNISGVEHSVDLKNIFTLLRSKQKWSKHFSGRCPNIPAVLLIPNTSTTSFLFIFHHRFPKYYWLPASELPLVFIPKKIVLERLVRWVPSSTCEHSCDKVLHFGARKHLYSCKGLCCLETLTIFVVCSEELLWLHCGSAWSVIVEDGNINTPDGAKNSRNWVSIHVPPLRSAKN